MISKTERAWAVRPTGLHQTVQPAELSQEELKQLLRNFRMKYHSFPNGSCVGELRPLEGARVASHQGWWIVYVQTKKQWKGVKVSKRMVPSTARVDFGVHYFDGNTIPENLVGLV